MKRESGSSSDASDASERSRAGAGARSFRVRVCMKQYFSDARALAYVCVRARRPVRWLQRRLRALFALPPGFVLLSRGHLLPPDEPLAVLRRDDPVDVIPSRGEDDGCVESRVGTSAPESGVGDSGAATPTVVDRDFATSGVASPSRDRDVVDAGVVAEPAPASRCDEEDELSERKRRALLLLHRYSEHGAEREPRAARPRRRRVRRRRRASPRRPSAAAGDDDDASMSSVLHNSCERARPPRLVRPLGDDAPL